MDDAIPSSNPATSNSLTIRLAEAAVTLRPVTSSSVEVTSESTDRPGVLRGLLILSLAKPTKVTHIDVSLTGKSAVRLNQRAGTKVVEQLDTHVFFEASSSLFTAKSIQRRGSSVSPVRRTLTSSSGSTSTSSSTSSSLQTPVDTEIMDSVPEIMSPNQERGRKTSVKKGFASLFRSTSKQGHGQPRVSSSTRIGEASSKEDKSNEGSKLFQPGTYTYPIDFLIPVNAPPSISCKFGKVTWSLEAAVHRPGTFKSKLSATRAIRVDRNPLESETSPQRVSTIEKEWEDQVSMSSALVANFLASLSTQLRYTISFDAQKAFIGGTIPVSFSFLPLDKMKIFEIQAFIEEQVQYLNKKRETGREEVNYIKLMAVQCPDHKPILPLVSDDVDFFKKSALYSTFSPAPKSDEEIGETASSLMGPGPWNIWTHLQITDDCSRINKTMNAKEGSILVSHRLVFKLRVQRSNAEVDEASGKAKQFTITVKTALDILSCRCNPAWSGLPPYSESFSPSLADRNSDICPCNILHDHWRVRPNASPEAGWRIMPPPIDETQVASPPVDEETVRLLFRNTVQYQTLLSSGSVAPPSYYDATELGA
ncbi:hypothetical protein DL96DRAFT_1600377 [Flagelloscypha sp. PMI_526]|nr:hypothetical protein DL96DRAFT_1600377 [Flagelloscypha sp. PMI_526]